jgi:quercetin dioxygenase-like cupin family protein
MHRTDTIDFITVISGRMQMYLDDGEMVEIKAGDVMVQRGTMHAWVNPGPDPCVMSFVLMDAEPLPVPNPLPRDNP